MVASFAGSSADYAPVNSGAAGMFKITVLTPTVTVSDAGGVVTGSPFVATATVTDLLGIGASSLEGVTPTLTYYAGNTAAGTPLSGAPTAVGTYTVIAKFPWSRHYTGATSSPVTFRITTGVPPQLGILLLDASGSGALNTNGGGSHVTVNNGSIVADSSNSQAIQVSSGVRSPPMKLTLMEMCIPV